MLLNKYLLLIVKLLLSIGIIYWLVLNADTNRILNHINFINSSALVFISLVVVMTSVPLAYRWIILLRQIGAFYPLVAGVKNVLIGFFFNQFLPSTVGGDSVRMWLANRDGVALTASVSTVIADRIHGFFGLLIVCLLGLPLVYYVVEAHDLVLGISVLLGLGFGGMLFLVVLHGLPPRYQKWRNYKYIKWIGPLADAAAGALTKKEIRYQVVLISIALHLIDLTLVYVMAVASGIELTWFQCLILVPPAILVSSLPLSVAGWGLREGAMVLALSKVGVVSADAITLSLFFGLSQMIGGLVGGVIWLTAPTGTLQQARLLEDR